MTTAHASAATPAISVVIPTRNRGASIVATVESILSNRDADYEIVVVDQSTNHLTRDALAKFAATPNLRLVRSNTQGSGRARNIGLKVARGPIVLFTDDDCRVPTHWIATMAACFAQDPRIGVVFCNVIAGPHDQEAGFVPTYVRDDDQLVRTLAEKRRARGIGAGFGVRRKGMLKLGGFDAMLGPGARFSSNEEGDLAVRALLHGWWIYETCSVAVVHDGFRTWAEGKALGKRNGIGVGAAYAKPLKCGHWRFAPVVLYESFGVALGQPLRQLLHGQRPRGLRAFWYFWQGFVVGWRSPVDPHSVLFIEPQESRLLNRHAGQAIQEKP